jgi:MFS family permease
MCGFGTVLFQIYMPIFIETFYQESKGVWLPMLTVTSPLGTTLGYVISGGVLSLRTKNEFDEVVPFYHWNTPFYAIFVLSVAAYLFVCVIPEKYLNIDEVQTRLNNAKQQ